ncbi:hypothetical protein [Idiomarina abyssalis]|uniref:hypothetical protein n=1 Tax=Idiomarina abyssalis TaxID=86102 RepID=UPI003A9345B5
MTPIDHSTVTQVASEGLIAQLVADKELPLFCKVSARKAVLRDYWTAGAHGRFSGYCYLNNKDAVECLRKGKAKITSGKLSTEGFIDWSNESPFKVKFPIANIKKWQPMEVPETPVWVHAIFNPTAHAPITSQLEKFATLRGGNSDLEKLFAATANEFSKAKVGAKASLDMRPVEVYKLDLLIELEQLKALVSPKTIKLPHQDIEGKARWELHKELESAGLKPLKINLLLHRVMKSSGETSAKGIFNLIEEDFYSADQELDVADTVTRITETHIYWSDNEGKECKTTFKTLENRLPKLRKLV